MVSTQEEMEGLFDGFGNVHDSGFGNASHVDLIYPDLEDKWVVVPRVSIIAGADCLSAVPGRVDADLVVAALGMISFPAAVVKRLCSNV